MSKYNKSYYDEHSKEKILYSKQYQQQNKEKQYVYVKRYLQKTNYYNNLHLKQRQALLELLGNKCIRCGFLDSRALQFDHIFDDGYLDKQRFKQTHTMLYYYYKNPEEAKKRLQILCANCNWIKRFEIKKHNQHNR